MTYEKYKNTHFSIQNTFRERRASQWLGLLAKCRCIAASLPNRTMIQCPVRDMAQNLFIPIKEDNALISTSIFSDITSPQLLSFILNLNTSKVCF